MKIYTKIKRQKENALLFSLTSLMLTGFSATLCAGNVESTPDFAVTTDTSAATQTCTATLLDKFRLFALKKATAGSFTADADGNFYVGGTAYDQNGRARWVVRKSSNQGATWQTVDNYQYSPGASTSSDIYPFVGTDILGNIYAVGFGFDQNAIPHWIMRKSVDFGISWNVVDDFQLKPGSTARGTAFCSNEQGDLFVCGNAVDKTGYNWIVRKSSDAGSTWQIVDRIQNSEPNAIGIDVNGNLYATGYITTAGSCSVRKSSDNGTTWTTVNRFSYNGLSTSATGFAAAPNGDIYVALTAYGPSVAGKPPVDSYAVIRKSTDAGATWTTESVYQHASGFLTYGGPLTVDQNGNLYAANMAYDATGGHWIVRVSEDGGTTWTQVDNYQLLAGKKGMMLPKGMGTDTSGNVYTVGLGSDKAGGHWIVRKVACE